jgi:DNA phosphorothioation-associated putative methyltransferase
MKSTTIERHKTAIRRGDYSRPVKCLLRDGLLGKEVTFFDYGCGRGEDVELLGAEGVACGAWDPAYRPDAPRLQADVVNLGYVINVIENPEERAATLRTAWGLCRQVLAVSAQVLLSGRGKSLVEFGDGVLTARGTFQKFFDQGELRLYLEEELQAEAVPAGVGVFYLFKEESKRQQFLANRFHRPPVPARRRTVVSRFEDNRNLLEPFMAVVLDLGRIPAVEEFPRAEVLIERFGSLKRALAFVERETGTEECKEAARRRREDLLVYLALSRFRKRPTIKQLPQTLQRDMRVFFGSYAKACNEADKLLFQAGSAEAIDQSCRDSKVGKLLPDALYVHRSALDALEPLLRIYEGCARAYLGEIDEANLIKLHRHSGKVSYLAYPDFETDPHPSLVRSVKLSLRTRELECFDYARISNPPILHRKETFLHPSHSLYDKFARLTEQEDKHGLLSDSGTIGTRDGWRSRLQESGFTLRGHRLVRLSGNEPGDGVRPGFQEPGDAALDLSS